MCSCVPLDLNVVRSLLLAPEGARWKLKLCSDCPFSLLRLFHESNWALMDADIFRA
jgi:hypothetical protein